MKKATIIIILCFLSFFVFSTAVPSPTQPFYLLGYIKDDVRAWIDLAYDSLPFDLTNDEVQFNETTLRYTELNKPKEIRGLYVGKFSLFSNTRGFQIYIAHTRLEYTGSLPNNMENRLSRTDYRLYIQMGSKYENLVKSCLSSDTYIGFPSQYPETETSDLIIVSGMDSCFSGAFGNNNSPNNISVVNSGVYVSLEDNGTGSGEGATKSSTDTVVEKLLSGIYSSTIYLQLVKE